MQRRLHVLGSVLALVLAGSAHAKIPSDPLWAEQWAQRVVGVPAVWDVTTGDSAVVIATIDTGVNASLPDLAGAIAPGWDFVDNDAIPEDTHGHGTLVATVLAARGDNGLGLAGYCWRCRVMPLRVAATDGMADPEVIAAAITWAVDHGARIVNVSYAHFDPNPREAAAVRYAVERGVLVVASAGNTGDETRHYPAAYPGVLSAAATDESDTLFEWSTRGSWVSISAPGCHVVIDYLGGHGTLCGTSFTPVSVSGVAGLILSNNPSLSTAQAAQAIFATARKPVSGIDGGRIDAWAAFAHLGWQRSAQVPGLGSWVVARSTPERSGRAERETLFQRGALKTRQRFSIVFARGPVDAVLRTARASQCTLILRSPLGGITAPPGAGTAVALSAFVASGRHTIEIACTRTKRRPYSLEVTAMFPDA